MKIGEYEQMMAYLKKPNRLFTSKRQDTIGGGNIQGDDLGSRTGFAGPELVKRGENKGQYRVKYRDPELGKREDGTGFKENKKFFKTKKEAQKFYDDRQKTMGELKSSGPVDIKTKQTEQINNFVNNFIDENLKSYGIKDYNQFEKDMVEAFKNSGIKDASGRSALSGNLPNIGTYESRVPFTKFGLDPAYRQKVREDLGRKSDLQNHFKKIFYSGVLENNPDLVNNISRYLDYENIDKKFYKDNPNKLNRAALAKEYADVLTPEVESDFIFMMKDMEQPKLRGTIFKKYFGDKYDKYIEKKNAASRQYELDKKTIEKKLGSDKLKEILGEDTIKKFMDKQHKVLNKIFDTSVFTGADRGLLFTGDHLEGISEIAKYENKDDMIRGLLNVVGTTADRNRELGWKTLSRQRGDLIKNIQEGRNVKTNVEELNRITKLSYPDFKGNNFYKYDPATKNVVPTKNFVVKYNPEDAYKRYFTELSTTEKGAKGLLQQAKPGSELVQFLTKDEQTYKNIADNLFNQLRENKDIKPKEIQSLVSSYNKQKEEALQEFGRLFCRTNSATGGRINLAQAGSANICSPEEMLSNMKKDRAIAQGTDEAAALARGRLLKAGKSVGKVLGYVAAPADIALELAFAGPSLLRGDVQGAINATTYGLLGGSKTGMEQVGEKFGTDSTEYALYGVEKAITDKIKATGYLDQTINRLQELGIKKSDTGEQSLGLGGARQDFATKQLTQDFLMGMEEDKKSQQDFETFYPRTVDKMKNTEALQNIADFSTAQQPLAGKLDPKTVEGFIKSGGGVFEKEMLPRFTLPQYEENIQRLKELRIADFPVDLQSQLAAYEKSQMPSQQQQDLMLRQQLQSPLDFTVPYDQLRYKGFKEGGRINFSNGGRLTFYVGGGADMGGVADSQGNVGPSGGGNNDGPDDRSTAAQTAAHNAAVAAAQAANKAAEEKMNILDTLNRFRPNTFVNPNNYSVNLNKNIGPFGFNFGINTLGILGIDDPRTEEDESEEDDFGISAGFNTDVLGGNLSLGAGYNPTTGTNLGLSFSKQFNQGGRVGFADGPEDPKKRATMKKMGIAGGIAGGLMTGLINVLDLFKGGAKTGIAATKAAESEAQKVFFDLVNAVKNKGVMNKLDDLLETKVGVKYEYKGVEVLEDGENIELRFNTDKGAPAVVEYRKPGYEVDPDAQTSYKVPGEFVAEGQEVGRYGKDGDVDIDFEDEIIDTFEDTKKIIDD